MPHAKKRSKYTKQNDNPLWKLCCHLNLKILTEHQNYNFKYEIIFCLKYAFVITADLKMILQKAVLEVRN